MKFEKVSFAQYTEDVGYSNRMEWENIKLPKRATKMSAGYDFFSPIDFTLNPGENIRFPSGVRSYIDEDKVLLIFPRSGAGFKHGIQLSNTVGVIDADFVFGQNEGDVSIKLVHTGVSNKPYVVNKGDAVCQGIIVQYFKTEDDFVEDERTGGLGSTDKETHGGK